MLSLLWWWELMSGMCYCAFGFVVVLDCIMYQFVNFASLLCCRLIALSPCINCVFHFING
jgi:hypothetical protein